MAAGYYITFLDIESFCADKSQVEKHIKVFDTWMDSNEQLF